LQHSLNAKYQQTESASWSARHHPFGDGHGQTGTVFGPVQGRKHGLQYLTHNELQMQTLHPVQDGEVKPHHQAGTLQTKADTLNQPQRTTHLAPRFHPMGGSFAHTAQKGYGSEKVQDAQTAEDTTTKTPEQPHGELLAQGCGRIAEFLAQAPWNEQ